MKSKHSPEIKLLLVSGRLCLGTTTDEEAVGLLGLPLNWAYLLEKATEEGMVGVLAFQLKRLARTYDLDLPVDLFRGTLHKILARNMALFAALSSLGMALRQRGLRVILLKGGALIETVYRGHPGVRSLSDLDLLVKVSDLFAVKEVLSEQGFHPLSTSSTFFRKGEAAFDLHTDLTGTARIMRRGMAFRFDEETLWQEAFPLDLHDPTFLILSPRHQFLHLAIHALKHSFSRLIWFIDMGMIFRQVKCEELLDLAKISGTVRPLGYAMDGLAKLLHLDVPSRIRAFLPQFTMIERVFLHTVLSRRVVDASGEMIVASSIPGFFEKLGYLFEFSFPSYRVLAEVFPSTPFWLIYPRRLGQLLAVGIRGSVICNLQFLLWLFQRIS